MEDLGIEFTAETAVLWGTGQSQIFWSPYYQHYVLVHLRIGKRVTLDGVDNGSPLLTSGQAEAQSSSGLPQLRRGRGQPMSQSTRQHPLAMALCTLALLVLWIILVKPWSFHIQITTTMR